jgi:hypothetical protein
MYMVIEVKIYCVCPSGDLLLSITIRTLDLDRHPTAEILARIPSP